MHVCRDTAAIKEAATTISDAELRQLIAKRIEELAEYDCDLAELVNLIVVEAGDVLSDIDAELGFSLMSRPIDVVESHVGWYELTFVLGDDGKGIVLYVPKVGADPEVLALCQAHEQESSMP